MNRVLKTGAVVLAGAVLFHVMGVTNDNRWSLVLPLTSVACIALMWE